MASQLYNNVSDSTLDSISDTQTSFDLVSGNIPSLDSGDYIPIYVIRSSDGAFEIMHVTGVSGSTITVDRAAEGTSPLVFPSGESVQIRPTRQSLLDLEVDIGEKEVSTETGSQTLQNSLNDRATKDDADILGLDDTLLLSQYDGQSTDAASAIQSIIDGGSSIIDLMGGTYRVDSTLTIGKGQTVKNGIIDFSSAPTDSPLFSAQGTLDAPISLSTSTDEEGVEITLTDASSISNGDIIFLSSSATWSDDGSSLVTRGELLRVVSVSGNVVTVDSPVICNYNTGDSAQVERLSRDKDNIRVENIIATGGGETPNHRFIDAKNLFNFSVVNCVGDKFAHSGVYMETVYAGDISNNTFTDLENPALGYGVVGLRACRSISVFGNTISRCRVGVSWGGTKGVNLDLKVSSNTVNYSFTAGINTKNASARLLVSGNTVNGDNGDGGGLGDGMLLRGTDMVVTGNFVRSVARVGIFASLYGEASSKPLRCVISSNIISETTNDGIQVLNGSTSVSIGCVVSGNSLRNVAGDGTAGIRIRADTANITDYIVSDNVVTECEGDGVWLTGQASSPGINARGYIGINRLRLTSAAESAGKLEYRTTNAIDHVIVSTEALT